ncbi:hypothetical protein HK104_002215, partial [Borealophlyctis nickersoniae]
MVESFSNPDWINTKIVEYLRKREEKVEAKAKAKEEAKAAGKGKRTRKWSEQDGEESIDRVYIKDEIIGSVYIPMSILPPNKFTKAWRPIDTSESKFVTSTNGELLVEAMHIVPTAEQDEDLEDTPIPSASASDTGPLDPSQLTLEDVLLRGEAMVEFMQYMDSMNASDYVQMYVTIDSFRQFAQAEETHALSSSGGVTHDVAVASCKSDAIGVWETFFGGESRYNIHNGGLPFEGWDELGAEIWRDIEARPGPDVFSELQGRVVGVLKGTYFEGFKRSEVFRGWCEEKEGSGRRSERTKNAGTATRTPPPLPPRGGGNEGEEEGGVPPPLPIRAGDKDEGGVPPPVPVRPPAEVPPKLPGRSDGSETDAPLMSFDGSELNVSSTTQPAHNIDDLISGEDEKLLAPGEAGPSPLVSFSDLNHSIPRNRSPSISSTLSRHNRKPSTASLRSQLTPHTDDEDAQASSLSPSDVAKLIDQLERAQEEGGTEADTESARKGLVAAIEALKEQIGALDRAMEEGDVGVEDPGRLKELAEMKVQLKSQIQVLVDVLEDTDGDAVAKRSQSQNAKHQPPGFGVDLQNVVVRILDASSDVDDTDYFSTPVSTSSSSLSRRDSSGYFSFHSSSNPSPPFKSPLFMIQVERLNSSGGWLLTKTYTDFTTLNDSLRSLFPKAKKVDFPTRVRKSAKGREELAGELERWTNVVLNDEELRSCEVVSEFMKPENVPKEAVFGNDGPGGGNVQKKMFGALRSAGSVLRKVAVGTPIRAASFVVGGVNAATAGVAG